MGTFLHAASYTEYMDLCVYLCNIYAYVSIVRIANQSAKYMP